jgi:fatty-acid peroxygenase
VRQDFEWRGLRFRRGVRVLLDLHGTNHDDRLWDAPEEFRPERFLGPAPGPFSLVPQGGADHAQQHRCAGEWITIELLRAATAFLAGSIQYQVPPQDLRVDLARFPTRPASGFVMSEIERRPGAATSGPGLASVPQQRVSSTPFSRSSP